MSHRNKQHGSVLAGISLMSAVTCLAAPPSPGHPIVGTWQVHGPGTDCIESWYFGPDGTTHNQSGDEDSYSEYSISDKPTAEGYYILIDTIVQTNGGTDCSGQPGAPIGDIATIYLVPIAENRLKLCFDRKLTMCPGLMVRVPGHAS